MLTFSILAEIMPAIKSANFMQIKSAKTHLYEVNNFDYFESVIWENGIIESDVTNRINIVLLNWGDLSWIFFALTSFLHLCNKVRQCTLRVKHIGQQHSWKCCMSWILAIKKQHVNKQTICSRWDGDAEVDWKCGDIEQYPKQLRSWVSLRRSSVTHSKSARHEFSARSARKIIAYLDDNGW